MKTRVMKQQLRQEIAPHHPYNPMLFDAVYAALDELEWLRAENARIAEEHRRGDRDYKRGERCPQQIKQLK